MHRFLTAMTECRTMQAHRTQTMFTSELSTGTAGSFPGSIKSSHLVLQTGGALFSFCWRRLFFYVKCEMRRRLQPRVCARGLFSHNMDYVNYGVHMWYVSNGKCLYVDRLPHVVLLMGKNGQNDRIRCRKPPPADPTLGVVLVQLLTHLPVEFCPPAPL